MMSLSCSTLALEQPVRGLVVRPRPGGGGPDQTLVFLRRGEVHELLPGGAGGGYEIGPHLASVGGDSDMRLPAYDPDSQAVFYSVSGTAIGKLDASNRVSAVAGSGEQWGLEDGVGAAARFKSISSLSADGRGGVWVADCDRIRRLDTRSREVVTLRGAEAPGGLWNAVAFDLTGAGTLWAAKGTALCRVRTERGCMDGRVELAAVDWEAKGSADGRGQAARFTQITAILPMPMPGGRLLIVDGPDLRCMDAGGAVTTLLRDCFPAGGFKHQMVFLPGGGLGVTSWVDGEVRLVSGGDFTCPSQPPTATAATDRLLSLLAPQAAAEGGGGSGEGGSSAAASLSGAVTVRVGDRAFPAHRSVLAAGSEYFARLLAPGGGFAESGAAEVSLPDADSAAFAHLLSYMYCTSLGAPPQILALSPDLLRVTTLLAGRLLMGGAVAALMDRLAATVRPASVLSDLAWADAHGMTDLAERLRAHAVLNRKSLDPNGLEQLAEECPRQAAELLKSLAGRS